MEFPKRTTLQIFVDVALFNINMVDDHVKYLTLLDDQKTKIERRIAKFQEIGQSESKIRSLFSKKYANYIRDAWEIADNYIDDLKEITEQFEEVNTLFLETTTIQSASDLEVSISRLPNLAYISRS